VGVDDSGVGIGYREVIYKWIVVAQCMVLWDRQVYLSTARMPVNAAFRSANQKRDVLLLEAQAFYQIAS
jgi:hypothetical protein